MPGAHRAEEGDVAGSLLAHVGKHGAGCVQDAEDVGVEAVVSLLRADGPSVQPDASQMGARHLPCFLDGALEYVPGRVDEDVEAADFCVQVCYGTFELLEVVGHIEICCNGAFAL